MQVFNVEFFDTDFNPICNFLASEFKHSMDYLTLSTNELKIHKADDVNIGNYIRITSEEDEFVGIVSAIESLDDDMKNIKYNSFMSLFDAKILFDTNDQGKGSVELEIVKIIREYFIKNEDSEQNIFGMDVIATTSTLEWGFNLKSDVQDMHRCVINFYKSIIVRAFEKYGVVVSFKIDVQNKRINVSVGKNKSLPVIIEADMSNVIRKNIVIKKNENSTNKLIVYNETDFIQKITYYAHPGGNYDQSNMERMFPVVCDIKHAKAEGNSTFADAAKKIASDVFSVVKHNNLIELWVLNDDNLIGVKNLEIGQECRIMSNGVEYLSVLSGKERSDTTRLIFGTVRLDLTKKLRR